MIRAVLDTSCLVPIEMRRELLEAAVLEQFTAIWSPWIIAELSRVLVWRWIKDAPPHRKRNDLSLANEHRCSESAKRMMDLLLPAFELVAPLPPYPPAWESLTDVWDQPIWAAAKMANAQYVVSDNTRHFPPRRPDGRYVHEGIEYIGGRAFLAMLRDTA